jgi:hypothetical protein
MKYLRIISILIILSLVVVPCFIFPQKVEAATPWYNSAWLYRKQFTVTGTTAGIQTNYQTSININFGGGVNTTGLYQEPTGIATYAMEAGSGVNTIVDAVTGFTSAVDDYYNGCTFYNITRGLVGTITDYVGASRTATTTTIAAQANTDTYFIIGRVPTVYVDGLSQVDFDDIRFTASDGVTLLSAYLESKTDSVSAIVWVKLNSIPVSPNTTTFYIYFGNPTISSNWSINDTFVFGDDFNRANSATVGNGWVETEAGGSTAAISASTLLLTYGAGACEIYHATANLPNRFLFRGTMSVSAMCGTATGLFVSPQTGSRVQSFDYAGDQRIYYYVGGYTNSGYIYPFGTSVPYTMYYDNVANTWDLTINYGAFRINGVVSSVGAITNFISIPLLSAAASTATIDNIFIQTYAKPEPLITAWATVEVQATPVVIQDVKVFQSYKTTNDWLIAIRYLDIYAPYYDTYDIKQYFVFQLTNAAGTVLAQTTLPRWGNSVGNIYLSPTLAGSLTYGGVYYVKIYGLFSGNPVVTYTIVGTDWQGSDLTRLDSWVISSASVLNTYYTPTAFTTYIAGRGELLNAAGGSIFDTGINGLSTVRPNIFQTYTSSTIVPANVYTQPYRVGLSAWQTNIGADGTVMLTRLGNLVGVPGNMIAMFLFVVMMVVLAIIAFPAGATLAANILSIPMLFAGIFFGFDLIYILLLALFAAFLLAKKLFMDTGA